MRVSTSNKEQFDNAAIVSLFGLYNFGNRLQGYAVDQILIQLGIEPTTLVFYRKLGISKLKDSAISTLRSVVEPSSLESKRRVRFESFVQSQRIQFITTPTQIKTLHNKFDWFVVGSDQVWNPNADLYPKTKFLEFARPEQRIALAPSIGVPRLPAKDTSEYRNGLLGFRHVSIREVEGASIVNELTGRQAEVLPDPTLGITPQLWHEVANSGRAPEKRYVLTYFLGQQSPNTRQRVDEARSRLKADVIELTDKTSDYWGSGPQDFLALIRNASVVLTDSYHASIFATLFEVPFYVFKRVESQSTYSRISTLLDSLELYGHESSDFHVSTFMDQDFSRPHKILDSRRRIIFDFLRKSTSFE